MKTSELQGAALDWAVAKCEGLDIDLHSGMTLTIRGDGDWWNPSFNWSQGGPIIEREGVCLWSEGYDWEAKIQTGPGEWLTEWDASPLVAAMRCYVASKLGDEVDIPEGLQ